MKKVMSLLTIFTLIFNFTSYKNIVDAEEISEDIQEIFFEKDFEEDYFSPFDNIEIFSDNNNIKLASEENENHYMCFEKSGTGSVGMRKIMRYSDVVNEEKMILQFDVSGKSFDASVNISVVDTDNKSHAITISKNKINNKEVLKADNWVRVAIVYNFKDKTIKAYAGENEVYSASNITPKNFYVITIMTTSQSEDGAFYFDNFYVYSGDKILSTEELKKTSYASYVQTEFEKKKENTDAFSLCGNYIVNDVKGKSENLVTVQNDEILISTKSLASIYGKTIANDELLPYKDAFAKLEKEVAYDGRGFLYCTSGGEELTDDESRIISSELIYDRPSAEYLKTNVKKSHPRLLLEEGRIDEIKNEIINNEYAKSYYERSESLLKEYMNADVVAYSSEGSMLLTSREVLDRVSTLSLYYLITDDEAEKAEYKEKLWKEVEAACDFPDWNPINCLDNAEMAGAIARAYDWMYDEWNDSQKEKMETALYEKALKYAVKIYGGQYDSDSTWWVNTSGNNQNAVANGGYILASLAVIDKYPDEASWVLEKALRSIEGFQNSFYPGGSWRESVTYWTYSMKYWAPSIRSLTISYGTDFGMSKAPDIEKSAEFVLHASSLNGANNFHDGGDNIPVYYIGSFFSLAKIFNRSDLADIKLLYDNITPVRAGIGVLVDFPSEASTKAITLNKDSAFYKDGFISFREAWADKNAMYASFHGGEGFPGHGHIDTGTFVVDMLGERFAVDLGTEDYALEAKHGAENLYRIRPEGHNCIVINPDSYPGQEKTAFSPIETFSTGEYGGYAVLNMTESYISQASSVRRGIKTADNRNSVIIRDEISSLTENSTIYWFMHTKADVEVLENNKSLVLTLNGKNVKFEAFTDAEDYELKVMEAKPFETSPQIYGQKDNSEYKKIAIVIKAQAGENVSIAAKLSPATDDVSAISAAPLDSWENDTMVNTYVKESSENKKIIRADIHNQNVFPVIAVYKENKLFDTAIAKKNSIDGKTAELTIASNENSEIKLFVWQSPTTLKPLFEPIPINPND